MEHAGSLSLEASSGDSADSGLTATSSQVDLPAGLAAKLQEAVAPFRSGRSIVLVGIDRAHVESLEMTLPPADERELPEMVLNQAMRESPAIADDSVLDFLPLTDSADEQRHVTALAMPPARLATIKSVCESAGITPQRVLFRPFASSSLFLNTAPDRTASRVLVNLIDDTADLSVVSGGRLVLTRTVRLPGSADATAVATRIAAEIRRTIVLIPQERLVGEEISAIVVFGRNEDHGQLLNVLASETSLPVSTLDPSSATGCAPGILSGDSGRFAALIGMLADESAGRSHAVDLLNPRRPPKTPSRRRKLMAAGGLAGIAILGGLWFVLGEMSAVGEFNAGMERELKELDAEFKKLDKTRQLAGAVEEWESGSVNWLDELKALSVKFPSSRDAVILRMSMSPSRGGGGVVTIQGQARNPAVVEAMGQNIRDDAHAIQTPRVQERLQEKSYTWQFETSIFVAGQSERMDDVSAESKTSTTTARRNEERQP